MTIPSRSGFILKSEVDFRSILTEALYSKICGVVNRLIDGTQDFLPIGIVIYSGIDKTEFDLVAQGDWVECEGQSIVGTDLEVNYGQTNAPDLRGVFIRGLDLGRGLDAGRVFSSFQDSDNKGHQHFQINNDPANKLETAMSVSAPFSSGDALQLNREAGFAPPPPLEMPIIGGTSGANSGRKVSTTIGGTEARPNNFKVYAYLKVSY